MESGGRKKRKMSNIEEDKDENDEGEEEKVKKFFALIRSTREVRDRLRNMPNVTKEIEELEKKKQEQKSVATAVWNPTFRPEDFTEDSKSNINPLPVKYDIAAMAGPSSKREQEKETKEKAEEDCSLDLKLSL